MNNKEGKLVCVKEEGFTEIKDNNGKMKKTRYRKIYRIPLIDAKNLIENQSNKEGEPTYCFTTKGAWKAFVKAYNKEINRGRAIQIRVAGIKGKVRSGGGNGKSTKGSKHRFIENKKGKLFKVKCN